MKQKQPLSNVDALDILASILRHNWMIYRRVPLIPAAKAQLRTAIRRDIGAVRFFQRQ